MYILQIEHQIHSFDTWKAAFERDPAGRQQGGVRHYHVFRPIDDPQYIVLDLVFDSVSEAEGFLAAMRNVCQSPSAAPALSSLPKARIVELVDSKAL